MHSFDVYIVDIAQKLQNLKFFAIFWSNCTVTVFVFVFIGRCTYKIHTKWHFLYIKSRSSAPSKEALSTPLLGIQEFQGWWGGGAQMPPQGGERELKCLP